MQPVNFFPLVPKQYKCFKPFYGYARAYATRPGEYKQPLGRERPS